jgi:drug/metabolite transporter (DMT)-like permease
MRAYLAWVFVCIVWGTTYLAIRICLETVPPLLMGGLRYTAAGLLMIAWMLARGESLPSVRAWPSLAVLGALMLACGNGGVVWAEQTVASGLTAVLVAMSPFWMVGFDALTPPRGPLTMRRALGLLVGFSGIVLLVWPEINVKGESGFLEGILASQIACIGWAVGSMYSKRRGHGEAKDESVLATAAYQMLFGGICLLLAGLAIGEGSRLTFTPRTGLALGYLIVFGAVAGFTAYAYALKHLPVATVSLYAYVNPLIAVALGTVILKEPLNPRLAVVATMVLVGIGLVKTEAKSEASMATVAESQNSQSLPRVPRALR